MTIDGRYLFLYFVIAVKSTDIGAYFIGSAIGRKKLCPNISPKKSVEGSIGGLLFSIICCIVLFWFVTPLNQLFMTLANNSTWLALVILIVLTIVLSVVGQIGDLIESIWKRDAGIKDSGNYIPGMGGVCDVIDSLLLAAPVLLFLLSYASFFMWFLLNN